MTLSVSKAGAETGFSQAAHLLCLIGLIAGFYLLATGMPVAFVSISYIAAARFGISLSTAVIMVLLLPAAVSIVAAILPRRLPETARTRLTREAQPELFERIDKAARIANRKPPRRVLLTLHAFNLVGRSSLSLGLPLLQAITIPQFDAALIRQLIRRCPGLVRMRAEMEMAIYRVRWAVWPKFTGKPLQWYGEWASRRALLLLDSVTLGDDRRSARLAGAGAVAGTITATVRIGKILEEYLHRDIGRALDAGYILPLGEGLHAVLSNGRIAALMDDAARANPKLQRRLSSLQGLPSAETRDDMKAISLLQDLPSIELALCRTMPGKAISGELKPVAWADKSALVDTSYFEKFLSQYGAEIGNLRLGDLHKTADLSTCGYRIIHRRKAPLLHHSSLFASAYFYSRELFAAAITSKLYSLGWVPVSEPWCRSLRKGSLEFDPYAVLAEIDEKRLTQAEWHRKLSDLGLSPRMPLSPLLSAADSADDANEDTVADSSAGTRPSRPVTVASDAVDGPNRRELSAAAFILRSILFWVVILGFALLFYSWAASRVR